VPLSAYERGYRFGQRARNTVFLSVAAWFIGAGATFWWHKEVFTLLLAPAEGMLSPFDGLPIATAAQDPFGSTLSLSMKGGQVTAFPVLVVGFFSMLKPFVPSRFWLFLTTYTVLSIGMFLTGASFVFFVMMPVSLTFLLGFGEGFVVPVILLTEYMALLLSLLFWIGIAFELPIAMQLLAKFRVISYPRAKTLRKWAYPTAFIFAALITPSLDGLLTFMVAIPMLLLYEFGLIASWLTYPDGGNYFADLPMVQRVRRWLRKVRDGIARVLRKVWIVAGLPVVMVRWAHRKVRDKA
jgi:sec-independent protein translocase protein TatC